jgi:phosphonate transport system substrate-binding protein
VGVSVVLVLAAVLLGTPAHAQARSEAAVATPLVFGVFPYVSPRALAARQGPLRGWLADELRQDVALVTATDFATFARRACRGDYDLVLTAPHLGRLAARDCGLRVLATTANRSGAVFIVRRDSGLSSLDQLRGQTLHMPSALAIVHQLGLEALQQVGIDPERDMVLRVAVSHNSALLAVLQEGGVGVVGVPTWQDPALGGRDQLVEIARSREIPGFVLLGNPARIEDTRLAHLARVLPSMHSQPAGERYFGTTGLDRFVSPEPDLLEQLDPFADRAARALEGS